MHTSMLDRLLEKAYEDSLGLVLVSLVIGALAALLVVLPILVADL